jgi:hypothetical protein
MQPESGSGNHPFKVGLQAEERPIARNNNVVAEKREL